ncbi:ClbS/DfsB family four-helix bundle protein [Celerinatantimonas yamalensis]|uniref:ClbS/DfsB family four-helix bundle protein n=1 Tax=Celerinatantimonas yamalensis TaxID=559956 RepID=A0ABW9G297_9GAMM
MQSFSNKALFTKLFIDWTAMTTLGRYSIFITFSHY